MDASAVVSQTPKSLPEPASVLNIPHLPMGERKVQQPLRSNKAFYGFGFGVCRASKVVVSKIRMIRESYVNNGQAAGSQPFAAVATPS